MTTTYITAVHTIPSDADDLFHFEIKSPVADTSSQIHNIKVSGWIVGHQSTASAIEVLHNAVVLRSIPVCLPHPDAANRYPTSDATKRYGFWGLLGTIGLPSAFELEVRVVFENGARQSIGRVIGRRNLLRTSFVPLLTPLIVTSLGRTGTTWLMRLLSHHPSIVVYREYPYEVRVGRYFMHLCKVLADPSDNAGPSHPDRFSMSRSCIGNNPFYNGQIADTPRLAHLLGLEYAESVATFCQSSTEAFYRRTAEVQNQLAPVLFAEKHVPDHIPDITWELYPSAREIFLVRDFRDMVCSMLAFNKKRGFDSFGRESSETDEGFVERLGHSARRLATAWRARKRNAMLLRYEDLVRQPTFELRRMLEYLTVDASDDASSQMLEAEVQDRDAISRHRTSAGALESVGRWKEDMDSRMKTACSDAFTDTLREFGYSDS